MHSDDTLNWGLGAICQDIGSSIFLFAGGAVHNPQCQGIGPSTGWPTKTRAAQRLTRALLRRQSATLKRGRDRVFFGGGAVSLNSTL